MSPDSMIGKDQLLENKNKKVKVYSYTLFRNN